MRVFELFGVRISDLSTGELTDLLSGWLSSDSSNTIVTPNPEFVLAARRDPSFVDLLNRADLSLPDGVGLRFAIPALTGNRLSNRHTGVDTLLLLAKLCAGQGKRLVLVGGGPGVAEAAAESMRRQFAGLDVTVVDVGIVSNEKTHTGSLSCDRTKLTSFENADVVAVALGMGKQERFIEALRSSHDHLANLPINQPRIYIGVGGAFDMIAGTKRRAPLFVRRVGLEWVWRLVIEPRRFKRIFNAAIVFPAVVVWDTLRRHRFVAACRATVPEIINQLKGK
ncbi:MAG: WecB/TagA/CpsF family glycosyltransferase [Candidatus Uhrbacteria bacterium]